MNLSRRQLFGGLAVLPLLTPALAARAQQPSLTFIFVEAADCEPCKRWHADEGHWWRTAPEFRRVGTIFVRAPHIRQAYSDTYWPAPLRKYRDAVDLQHATPGYIVVSDGRVVLSAIGYTAWRQRVYPALRQLVAAADGRSIEGPRSS